MGVTYTTLVIGEGNHASLEIPDTVLTELGTHKRAPLVVTVNGHTYRSTAVGVDGGCRVVFPTRERAASGVTAGDTVAVSLELDAGHRQVELHPELHAALCEAGIRETFEALSYSKRREFARQVDDAKADETRARRIAKVITQLEA